MLRPFALLTTAVFLQTLAFPRLSLASPLSLTTEDGLLNRLAQGFNNWNTTTIAYVFRSQISLKINS